MNTQAITSTPDGGTSRFYIRRPCDARFDENLFRSECIAIFGPRTIGKTTLLHHKYRELQQRSDYRTSLISLSQFGGLSDAQWYAALHRAILNSARTPLDHPTLAHSVHDLHDLLVHELHDQPERKLVIMLDDVEDIPVSTREPVMKMIREIMNRRGIDPTFERCIFVLAGCFLPEDLIQNPDFSPFRVAQVIYITDADEQGVRQMVMHRLHRTTRPVPSGVAEQIFAWTEGDLYLTNRLCDLLDRYDRLSVPLVDQVVEDDLVGDVTLVHAVRRLERSAKERQLVESILSGRLIRFNRVQRRIAEAWLHGLVKEDAQRHCKLRNLVYRKALDMAEILGTPSTDATGTFKAVDDHTVLKGRYVLEAPLDEGNQGRIYQATDMETNQTVAVKCLFGQLARDAEQMERFLREGETLKRLDHPHIVRFIEVFSEADREYIVMEFVSGGNLDRLINSYGRSMPVSLAVKIATGLADALVHVHSRNVIHRDLKPVNILLNADQEPILADFGIAHLVFSERLTQPDRLVGTAAYLSPEAFQSQALTTQSDLWSFGVVLYEMLSGKRPFTGDSMTRLMHAITTDPIPSLFEQRTDLPEELCSIVMRLLKRDLSERYASASDVLNDLLKLDGD